MTIGATIVRLSCGDATPHATSRRVFDQICIAIARGDMPAGAKMSRQWIIDKFRARNDVARATLASLERCRVLDRRGGGWVVTPPSELWLRQIGLLREALVGMTTREAARLVTPAVMNDLIASLGRQKDNLARPGLPPAVHMEEDAVFHRIIAAATGNPALAAEIDSDPLRLLILFRYHRFGGSVPQPLPMRRLYLEHCRIVDALDDRDADLAELAARRHVSVADLRAVDPTAVELLRFGGESRA